MMVCRYDQHEPRLVLQIDHSRIAGLLAAHWGNSDFARPKPYASMVLAAQEHDNGWWDWEIKPTVDEQGYPIDYINSILRRLPGVSDSTMLAKSVSRGMGSGPIKAERLRYPWPPGF